MGPGRLVTCNGVSVPPIHHIPKEVFMECAISEAIACRAFDEHPVGAVIVQNNEIVCQSGNRTHRDKNPTHHAEIVVIGRASEQLGKKYLSDCVLYTTHEPCPMCAAASVYARIGGIVFGTSIEDAVSFVASHQEASWRSIEISLATVLARGDHGGLFVVEGFLRHECASLFNLLLESPAKKTDGGTCSPQRWGGNWGDHPPTSGLCSRDEGVRSLEERPQI